MVMKGQATAFRDKENGEMEGATGVNIHAHAFSKPIEDIVR
jgi:hypothetical protein